MGKGAALETVIIYTSDMQRLAAWYRAGLSLGPFLAAPHHLGQRVGPVYLGFDEVTQADEHDPGSVHVWFTVDDVNYRHFGASGIRVGGEPARMQLQPS